MIPISPTEFIAPLKFIAALVGEMEECEDLCKHVHERMNVINDKLLALEQQQLLPQDKHVRAYSELVDDFRTFLLKHKGRAWVYRVVTSKRKLQAVRGFQERIQTLVMAVDLAHFAATVGERAEMATERAEMERFRARLEAAAVEHNKALAAKERAAVARLTDDATVARAVEREEQQVEALSVLIHELRKSSAPDAARASTASDDTSGTSTAPSSRSSASSAPSSPRPSLSSSSTSSPSTYSPSQQQQQQHKQPPTPDQRLLVTALDKVMRRSSAQVRSVPAWFCPPQDVEFDAEPFARGSFGTVHRGRLNHSDVVVKCLLMDTRRNEAVTRRFREEASLWFGFRHKHVLMMYGACDVSSPPFIVCELAKFGNLFDYLGSARHRPQTLRLLHEAATGLAYLHAQRVVHGDLKGDNILVAADRSAKVADFSFSYVRTLSASKQSVATYNINNTTNNNNNSTNSTNSSAVRTAGALRWRAPECLRGRSPSFASDVYSLGMCILEAVSLEVPWGYRVDDDTVRDLVKSGELPERPADMSECLWDLVTRMCRLGPSERPTLEAVVEELAKLASLAESNNNNSDDDDEGARTSRAESRRGFTDSADDLLASLLSSFGLADDAVPPTSVTPSGSASKPAAPTIVDVNNSEHPANDSEREIADEQPASTHPQSSAGASTASAKQDAADKDKITSLHAAAEKNRADVVEELLRAGADIEARDTDDWTPLHRAAWYGSVESVTTLVRHKANIESKIKNSWTPLHVAAEKNRAVVIVVLVRAGADIEARDAMDWTPLHRAAMRGGIESVKTLLRHKANINAEAVYGRTALSFAIDKEQIEIVRELLAAGAAVKRGDYRLARSKGHTELMQLLKPLAPPSRLSRVFG